MKGKEAAISSHPSRVISRGVTSSRLLSRGLLPPPPLPPRGDLLPVLYSPTYRRLCTPIYKALVVLVMVLNGRWDLNGKTPIYTVNLPRGLQKYSNGNLIRLRVWAKRSFRGLVKLLIGVTMDCFFMLVMVLRGPSTLNGKKHP